MAKQLLTLEEVIAMLQTVSAPNRVIESFTKQAASVLERKSQREIEIERPGEDREPGTDTITVTSGFGQRSRKGFVELTLNETLSQMPPGKAREVGIMLLEGAEAAISDEIFVTLIVEKVGLEAEHAGRMLVDLREIRQGTRGISWPS